MDFGPDKPNVRLIEAFRGDIDACIAREVLPHAPDAWVDYGKTKVGYEIPINRHFYVYKPPRSLDRIEENIVRLEGEIAGLLKGLVEGAGRTSRDPAANCQRDLRPEATVKNHLVVDDMTTLPTVRRGSLIIRA